MRRAITAASALACACSLTASLDGLSSGRVEGPESGGAPDGAVDAIARDAGGKGDAGAGFCATLVPSPSFCADFDGVSSPEVGWTRRDVEPGAGLSLIPATSTSAPRALRVTTPGEATARLQRDLGPVTRSVHVEVSMRFEKIGSDGSLMALSLGQTAGTTKRYIVLYAGATTSLIQHESSAGDYYQDRLPGPPARGVWYRFALDLEIEPAGTTMTATLDGEVVASAVKLEHVWSGDPIQLYVGAVYVFKSTTSWEVDYDDVVAVVE